MERGERCGGGLPLLDKAVILLLVFAVEYVKITGKIRTRHSHYSQDTLIHILLASPTYYY